MMHELSLANALLNLVRANAPANVRVRVVHVRAGPLQAIEPAAMQFAWQAATTATALEGALLELAMLPWRLRCRRCERRWQSADYSEACDCGSDAVWAEGSAELTLESIEVDAAVGGKEYSHGQPDSDCRERAQAQ